MTSKNKANKQPDITFAMIKLIKKFPFSTEIRDGTLLLSNKKIYNTTLFLYLSSSSLSAHEDI
jgi:hypothetical protein